MTPLHIPDDAIKWVRKVFRACNKRVSRKLSLVPQCPEASLDTTFIEHLSQYSSPRRLESGWTVRIDTHFLGGMRHFYGKWEIADIGILIHFRHNGRTVRSKAAALQSKRLYPKGHQVIEDLKVDYEIGFGRLDDPEDARLPLYHAATFQFDKSCRYQALGAHSEQFKAIDEYSKSSKIPVFYQFYNPLALPFTQEFPLQSDRISSRLKFGTRIVAAAQVHALINHKPPNYAPSVSDLGFRKSPFGWSLEHFVAELMLPCREGYIYQDVQDRDISSLFNRRTGAIAAAFAVVIEQPNG
jgi:hypothetical protein